MEISIILSLEVSRLFSRSQLISSASSADQFTLENNKKLKLSCRKETVRLHDITSSSAVAEKKYCRVGQFWVGGGCSHESVYTRECNNRERLQRENNSVIIASLLRTTCAQSDSGAIWCCAWSTYNADA